MKSAMVCAVGALLVLGEAASAVDQARSPVDQQRYVWYGQLVTVDQSARVATINARIPPVRREVRWAVHAGRPTDTGLEHGRKD